MPLIARLMITCCSWTRSPDSAVRHTQPVLDVEVLLAALRLVERLPHCRDIVRVDALKNQVDRRLGGGLIAENPETLLRPENIAVRGVPAESPGAAQLLRFCQVGSLAPSHQVFGASALGDVVVCLQGADRVAARVTLERPPARDREPLIVPRRVDEFALPASVTEQRLLDGLQRRRERSAQQVLGDPADGLIRAPAIKLFGAAIPIGDR